VSKPAERIPVQDEQDKGKGNRHRFIQEGERKKKGWLRNKNGQNVLGKKDCGQTRQTGSV
jgi:hypothetical protein